KAFAESPLRLLITQVLKQRCQVSLRPPEPVGKNGDAEPGTPGIPKAPKGFGPPSPGFPGSGAIEQPQLGADEQENIELRLYGAVTRYERPNRPAPVAPEQKQ